MRFSTLQRVEIAEIHRRVHCAQPRCRFQYSSTSRNCWNDYSGCVARLVCNVSVLFNESKLLKLESIHMPVCLHMSFSTLQRVEIAEIMNIFGVTEALDSFSTLQRVEIAEIRWIDTASLSLIRFSTLQRVEIAEIVWRDAYAALIVKFQYSSTSRNCWNIESVPGGARFSSFQYSSTSRNCWNNQRCTLVSRSCEFQYSSTSRNCWNSSSARLRSRRNCVSVLFNESKLLKFREMARCVGSDDVSVLFNESKLLKSAGGGRPRGGRHLFQYSSTSRNCWNGEHSTASAVLQRVSVLFNESKLLKWPVARDPSPLAPSISVLFNESKLLKWIFPIISRTSHSAFQYSSTSRNCWNPTGQWCCSRISRISVLFNESKLLKFSGIWRWNGEWINFSTLQRVEIAEIAASVWRNMPCPHFSTLQRVEIAEIQSGLLFFIHTLKISVLFNESKLLKLCSGPSTAMWRRISVLFNESKLLKFEPDVVDRVQLPKFQYSSTSRNCWNLRERRSIWLACWNFSTLQRVEIAEINIVQHVQREVVDFSTLQRVEIAEIRLTGWPVTDRLTFQYSSTSRNCWNLNHPDQLVAVCAISVLFNESKLLKLPGSGCTTKPSRDFSTLQRVEIAEIDAIDLEGFSLLLNFSTLQRVEIAEISMSSGMRKARKPISVLFNESKLLKSNACCACCACVWISVLFNESKLLKSSRRTPLRRTLRISVLFNESKLLK